MNIKQLITVRIKEKPIIELKNWNDGWHTEKVLEDVAIGEKGATTNKQEGDLKTPLGLFKLGSPFGIADIKADYPYLTITDNSYWIDDSMSPDYNKWIEVDSQSTHTWKSAEHLIEHKEYKLAFIIEYNTINQYDKINKGNNKGSAIFLHIKTKNYTAGCVATTEENLKYILNWLKPDSNPHILIKTE